MQRSLLVERAGTSEGKAFLGRQSLAEGSKSTACTPHGGAAPQRQPRSWPRSVLVVIPTLNEAANIERIVVQLLNDPAEVECTTIVVVDGGSTDQTVEIVEGLARIAPHVLLLNNTKKIQSAAVNLAVFHHGKSHEVVVRCDAHSRYPVGFVNRLLSSLVRTGADTVVVPMDTIGEDCIQRAIAWTSNSILGTGGAAHRAGLKSGFVDHGHHAAMWIDTFDALGGYDETFKTNEDAEFDARLTRVGGGVYLDADIRIGYFPRASFWKLARQYFSYGVGRSRTMRRHPASIRLRQLVVPANLCFLAISVPFTTLSKSFLIWPIFYGAILAFMSIHVAIVRQRMCGLLSSFAAFVMHTSWAAGFFYGLLSVRETRWIGDDKTIVSNQNIKRLQTRELHGQPSEISVCRAGL
jgi:succinoglycan biosynthesis protein ExoA